MCNLCRAFPGERVVGSFYILTCRKCKVPMIVLKEHRSILTEKEESEIEEIRNSLFPDNVLRGIGMRSEPGHWHEHLV